MKHAHKPINMRSKITVRWTTNPADMGYEESPAKWRTDKGTLMSVRKAAAFKVSDIVGQGVYSIVMFTHNGREVTRQDLYDVIDAAEYKRLYPTN